jgi:hypothetical protein
MTSCRHKLRKDLAVQNVGWSKKSYGGYGQWFKHGLKMA